MPTVEATVLVVDRVAEAQSQSKAARAETRKAEAAFAEVNARMQRGDAVTAAEFGEAELAVRLASTRAGIAQTKAREVAETDRRDRIAGFGNYAAGKLDRKGFDDAQAAFRAAAVSLFREMGEYNGVIGELENELGGLFRPGDNEAHGFRFGARLSGASGGFEASGKTFKRLHAEGVQNVLRDAYHEVFPRSGYPY